VALLLRLRLGLTSAVTLLTLFVVQFGLAFVFQHNEARTIQVLTGLAWFYLALAGGGSFSGTARGCGSTCAWGC